MNRKRGRPPKYKNSEDMQKAIDAYFASCAGELARNEDGTPQLDRSGRPIITGSRPPTVTGLALALGFATRKSLLDYQGKKEFMAVVCTAKLRVEEYAERQLFDRSGYIGARFTLLQNFQWREQLKTNDEQTVAPGVKIICVSDN